MGDHLHFVTIARETRSAQDTAFELGLTLQDVVEVVQSMKRAHFYKSMTSFADHRVWQDVYRCLGSTSCST